MVGRVMNCRTRKNYCIRKSCSRDRCLPCESKFSEANQPVNIFFVLTHSESSMENHAVSRLSPLITMCWRKTPSKVSPNRNAAFRDGRLNASHFHSKRRKPSVSNKYWADKKNASVAILERAMAGPQRMLPISMTPWLQSIRIKLCRPSQRLVFRSMTTK